MKIVDSRFFSRLVLKLCENFFLQLHRELKKFGGAEGCHLIIGRQTLHIFDRISTVSSNF